MKQIRSIRKTWALMTALSCCLCVLPMHVYAENETPAPEQEANEAAEIQEETVSESEPEKETGEEITAQKDDSVRGTVVNIGDSSLTWEISDSTLMISGSGEMPHYTDAQNVPWYSEIESITKLHIGAGVTRIYPEAFNILTNLTKVTADEDGVYTVYSDNQFAFKSTYLLIRQEGDQGTGYIIDYARYGQGYCESSYNLCKMPVFITGISDNVFPASRPLDVMEYVVPYGEEGDASKEHWLANAGSHIGNGNEALINAPKIYSAPQNLVVGSIFGEGPAGENVSWRAEVDKIDDAGKAWFKLVFSGTGAIQDYVGG